MEELNGYQAAIFFCACLFFMQFSGYILTTGCTFPMTLFWVRIKIHKLSCLSLKGSFRKVEPFDLCENDLAKCQ